jgi:putative membrane protein
MSKLATAVLATLTLVLAPQAFAQDAKKRADKGDQRHMRHMVHADMAEVELGKIAQENANHPKVIEFGRKMVEDHGKHLAEVRELAKKHKVELPKQTDKDHRAAIKSLKAKRNTEFDRAYMKRMVKDHEDALKLVRQVADKADNREVKQAAQQAIPVIQKHLEEAKAIATEVKAD